MCDSQRATVHATQAARCARTCSRRSRRSRPRTASTTCAPSASPDLLARRHRHTAAGRVPTFPPRARRCSSSLAASPSLCLSPRPSPSAIAPLASRWTTLPLSPTWSRLSTLRLSSSSSARWKRSWTAAGRRPKATSAPCHTCSASSSSSPICYCSTSAVAGRGARARDGVDTGPILEFHAGTEEFQDLVAHY